MTVRDTLKLFGAFLKKSGSRNVFDPDIPCSAVVMDSKYLSYPIRALSGGNKKKLSIVLANMHCPKALLLDECTSGIDPEAADRVLDYLNSELTDDQGLLFASHRVEECVSVCDRIVVMCDGHVVLNGPINRFYDISVEYYVVDLNICNKFWSISAAAECIDFMKSQLADRLSTDMAKREAKATVFTSCVVYSPTLARVMCRKNQVPLSVMWTLLEEMSISKHIRGYYFRDVGMEEILSVVISKHQGRV